MLARDCMADWLFAAPFLAVALSRSGRRDEALAVAERAVAELSTSGDWLKKAAVTHTHAMLLAQTGPPQMRAVLRYGDVLAGALWQQRMSTLHTAETMRSYERLRAEHEQMSRSAEIDSLTNVANRRRFDRELARQAGTDPDTCISVLLIDVDRLKALNDTLGHATGDATLRAVAGALAGEVRDDDVLARLGGDEFCALLVRSGIDGATGVAERMVEAVRDLHMAVTVSIGVAAGPSRRVEETLRRADAAMYVAKRAGGDRMHSAS
jgi:diguanylate cyclase (GGDEF)-like protein